MLLEEEREYILSFGKRFLAILKKRNVSEVQQRMYLYYINTYLHNADEDVDSGDKEETLGDLLGINDNKMVHFEKMKKGVLELFDILDISVEVNGETEYLTTLFENFCEKYQTQFLVEM